MINNKALFHQACCGLLASACSLAYGHGQEQAQGLTLRLPTCKLASTKILPAKYLALSKQHKEFAWAAAAKGDHARISAGGWERVDGSAMFDWFAFYRFDINQDGYCDWYLDAASPLSSGGDRDTINTVYLGQPEGWLRIGATIPDHKPDQLGFGKTEAEQLRFLFGEEPGVIYDAGSKITYLVTALYSRHARRAELPGYRILTWDAAVKTLRVLDKWQPGSKAAEVYTYFQKNGAYVAPLKGETAEEATLKFDHDVEKYELSQACSANAEQAARLSPHLMATCKRSRTR